MIPADLRRTLCRGGAAGVSVFEDRDGVIQCGRCAPFQHHGCEHVATALQDRWDVLAQGGEPWAGRVYPLVDRPTVPVIGVSKATSPLLIPVELGDPDDNRMRLVEIRPNAATWDVEAIGYVGPGEGRWVIRDLIIEWLVGMRRESVQRRCAESGCMATHSFAARSHKALVDTWFRLDRGRCIVHAEHQRYDDHLVPDFD